MEKPVWDDQNALLRIADKVQLIEGRIVMLTHENFTVETLRHILLDLCREVRKMAEYRADC